MIEIKDEILNGDARYRIRDNDGNILFDNLILEQITPIIQEPTPMNKPLFQALALQDRFYIVKDNTNVMPVTFTTNIVPSMSSTSVSGYSVSCSNWDEGVAYYPFDGNTSTRLYNSGAKTSTITLNCPKYIKLKQIKYTCAGSTTQALKVYGVENDGTRTLLGSYDGASSTDSVTYTISCSSSKHYNQFVFQYTGRGGIYTIELNSGDYIETDSPNTYLEISPEIALDDYKEGMKFNIQVPNNFNSNLLTTYIKLSGLDYIELDGLIYANKRYTIIYYNEKFVINA